MSDKFSLKDSQPQSKGKLFSPNKESADVLSKNFSSTKNALGSVHGDPGHLPDNSTFFNKRKQGKGTHAMAAIKVSLAQT